MALISFPVAHGGLGCLSLVADCESLYNIASARLNVPNDDESSTIGRLHVGRIRKEVDARKLQLAIEKDLQLGRRSDESVGWFDIQATTSRTKISDDAFRLGLANHIDAIVPYPTCRDDVPEEEAYNHSQCCHVCAGPYRFARHQRVQQEFLQCATAYGLIATSSLFSLTSAAGKRPDVAVFRGLTKQIPLLIDFSVAHQRGAEADACGRTDAVKTKKYATLLRGPDGEAKVEIAPFNARHHSSSHVQAHRRDDKADDTSRIRLRVDSSREDSGCRVRSIPTRSSCDTQGKRYATVASAASGRFRRRFG